MAANQQAKRKAILDALGKGHTRTAAAQHACCHIDTFYEWFKDPQFSEEVLKAEAEAHMEVIDIVRKSAPDSWQAAAWLAERHPQWKKEWKRLEQQEQSGPDNKPLQHEHTHDFRGELAEDLLGRFSSRAAAGVSGGLDPIEDDEAA